MLGMVLTITGIVLTIIFGATSLVLVFKYRYPGQLTFVSEKSIALFDDIASNISDLSVLYKGTPVSQRVFLIKGALLNTGRKDISPNMIERPVQLVLPEESKWLSATVISKSAEINAEFSGINSNYLTINTSMMRCDEFVRFQALADVKGQDTNEIDRLEESLTFEHRIQDTQSMRVRTFDDPIRQLKRMKKWSMFLVLGVVGTLIITGMSFFGNVDSRFVYKYKTEENVVESVYAIIATGSKIKLKYIDTEKRKKSTRNYSLIMFKV